MMFRLVQTLTQILFVDIESARDDAYINYVPTALVERKADAMLVTRQEKFTRLEADDGERDDLDINENSDAEEDIADDEPIAPALLSQIPQKSGTSTLPTADDAHGANAQFSASLVGNEQFLAEIDALTQGCGLPRPR